MVSGEMHEMSGWVPRRVHYDCYTGEPRDEQGRDDKLSAGFWCLRGYSHQRGNGCEERIR